MISDQWKTGVVSDDAVDGLDGLLGGGEGIGEGENFGGEVAAVVDFLEGGDDGCGISMTEAHGAPVGISIVDVADVFLDRGLVVATRGRSPEEDFNYSAGRTGTWRMPLVVVIDGDSASSSEILAGAIRDHRRGTIVGSRSYGKGSIQGIFPLEAAGVGMRLTTAKFFSPRGLPFSGVGVEPDVPVVTAARPIDGSEVAVAQTDAALAAAVDVARRSVTRPAAAAGRVTATR